MLEAEFDPCRIGCVYRVETGTGSTFAGASAIDHAASTRARRASFPKVWIVATRSRGQVTTRDWYFGSPSPPRSLARVLTQRLNSSERRGESLLCSPTLLSYVSASKRNAATRTGTTAGDGPVAQVDVTGLIATAFDDFDSRAGDPHLHTHVVISNKVRTVLDGKWRSLDGQPMRAAVVALSELHESLFADALTQLLGVRWGMRERGRDRHPVLSISSVPEALVSEFSTGRGTPIPRRTR
jgi:hypothetical protein